MYWRIPKWNKRLRKALRDIHEGKVQKKETAKVRESVQKSMGGKSMGVATAIET